MGELLRTMIVCGLVSGTQPLTVAGLLIVLRSPGGRKVGGWYVVGNFVVETSILLLASSVVGSAVTPDSGPGHTLFGIRLALGLTSLVFGLSLRRPAKKPAPEIPKALTRLNDLSPFGAFVAGIALADYQGPAIAAMALAAAEVGATGRLVALVPYTILATGIPATIVVVTSRSDRAHAKLTDGTAWVMKNRRRLASWVLIGLGTLLTVDAITGLWFSGRS